MKKVKLILDTDMLTDCDDLAAMAILHKLADFGEVDILATVVSSKHPLSAAVVDVVNTYYGRPDLRCGAPKNGTGVYKDHSVFLEPVSAEYPHAIESNDSVEDAVSVYRDVLAKAEDNSIVIATIGYMSNLEQLLKSSGDEFSPLCGEELVRAKVRNWVCMGGNFPVDPAVDNVNFTRDAEAACYTIRNWPGDIIFVGREIGHNIFIGESLRSESESNPVRRAYQLHRENANATDWNHHTADPCTILYAVRGRQNIWSMSPRGNLNLNEDCSFEWSNDENGNHFYLLQEMDRAETARILDRLLI